MTRCILSYHPLTTIRDRYGLLAIQYAIIGKVETEVSNQMQSDEVVQLLLEFDGISDPLLQEVGKRGNSEG